MRFSFILMRFFSFCNPCSGRLLLQRFQERGNSQVELEGLQGKIHHTVGAELPDAVLQPVQMLDARGTRMPTAQKGPLFRRNSCRHIFCIWMLRTHAAEADRNQSGRVQNFQRREGSEIARCSAAFLLRGLDLQKNRLARSVIGCRFAAISPVKCCEYAQNHTKSELQVVQK